MPKCYRGKKKRSGTGPVFSLILVDSAPDPFLPSEVVFSAYIKLPNKSEKSWSRRRRQPRAPGNGGFENRFLDEIPDLI